MPTENKQLAVHLPEHLREKLRAMAEVSCRSVSAQMHYLLNIGLSHGFPIRVQAPDGAVFILGLSTRDEPRGGKPMTCYVSEETKQRVIDYQHKFNMSRLSHAARNLICTGIELSKKREVR